MPTTSVIAPAAAHGADEPLTHLQSTKQSTGQGPVLPELPTPLRLCRHHARARSVVQPVEHMPTLPHRDTQARASERSLKAPTTIATPDTIAKTAISPMIAASVIGGTSSA